MILNLFRKPKWQHKDAAIRLQSVRSDKIDEEILSELVRNDSDSKVRSEACQHIERLSFLKEVITGRVSDPVVIDAALGRMKQLLGGLDPASPPLEKCLAEIAFLENQQLLCELALKGKETKLRAAAIERVRDQGTLVEIALSDSTAANRLIAVTHLKEKSALQAVVKRIGKKDKKAHRLARNKLRDITEQEAMPDQIRFRCEELYERMERLGQFGHWVEDSTTLCNLEQQWAEISDQIDPEWTERFQQTKNRFLSGYDKYRQVNLNKIEAEEQQAQLLVAKQQLIDSLGSESHGLGEEALSARVDSCRNEWSSLELLDPTSEKKLQEEFSKRLETAQRHLRQFARLRKANSELQEWLKGAKALAEGKMPLEKRVVDRMLKQIDSLLKEVSAAPHQEEHFRTLKGQLKKRLQQQQEAAKNKIPQLPAQITKLMEEIEKGELKMAESLYDEIRTAIQQIRLTNLEATKMQEHEAHFHQLSTQIQELRKWRKWGTDQQRELLCTKMESLIASETDMHEKAEQLHQLQLEWKQLDRSGSRVNKALWGRFHLASEQVYKECRPFFDEQAQVRASNLEEREALCIQLETFLEQADWNNMDWKKATQAERETRNTWNGIGPVEEKHRRALEKRFRAGMKKLGAHFSREIKRNLQFRLDLIRQMEALTEAEGKEQSTREAKQLQKQWHTTVTGHRKEENELWKRFRDASDEIFNRQRKQRREEEKVLQENLMLRKNLVRELDQLYADTSLQTSALDNGYRELKRRWQESSELEIPFKSINVLENSWNQAEQGLQQRKKTIVEEEILSELEQLRLCAQLCQSLEQVPGEARPEVLESAEERWRKSAEFRNSAHQTAMEKRFSTACKIYMDNISDPEILHAEQAENLRQQLKRCLLLETVAEVESPEAYAKERMALQVSRLSDHMRNRAQDKLAETSPIQLEQAWYMTGALPDQDYTMLESRFETARRAIHAKSTPSP
jgi:hypothetical protein